ncbi:MAG: imidazoleglycerol-phosphate dehydratase HisB [Planctomycetes bacterium]|nr:imidazoleglycerol-phosphate dehydratase HisB [Planctomycetota bacterium]
MSSTRQAEVRRETKETKIFLRLDLDQAHAPKISTGVGFFDHMLEALAVHARIGVELEAEGDLHIDQHHLVEDVGIVFGQALREALGEDLRIQRFAAAYAPLDDALARAVVDISGRAYLYYGVEVSRPMVGDFDTDLVLEFFTALTANARLNLPLDLVRGHNAHHQLEASFKAFALALRSAVRVDSELSEVPSTKGSLSEDEARKSTEDAAG